MCTCYCVMCSVCQITISFQFFALGKKYCYGSTQGEYCHCDYCKCKHGYGSTGYGHCHWLSGKKKRLSGWSRFMKKLTSKMMSIFGWLPCHKESEINIYIGLISMKGNFMPRYVSFVHFNIGPGKDIEFYCRGDFAEV